jgi:hypothetical protein
MDREFGLIHVGLQTWCPLQLQVYVNGHEWLARKLAQHGPGDRPRVEAIGVGHALEPMDAVAPAPLDEPESADGLLIAAEEVGEHVLDGPAILRAGPQDLALGQPREERQHRAASRRHASEGLASPGRERS